MQYRRLGRTNFMAAEVGIGASGLVALSAEDGAAVLRAAVSGGTNIIEVNTGDPAQLAAAALALKGLRPQLLVVGSGDVARGVVEHALTALGLDYFDCYLAAGARADLGEAQSLAGTGLARSIGLATDDATEALSAILDGGIDVLQLPFNALELRSPSGVDAVLSAARDADVGVLGCSPLAGGAFGASPAADLTTRLAFLLDGAPRSVAQAAIAWALTDPRVTAVVSSTSSPEHALENAAASALAPLDEGLIERIAAALQGV